MWTRAGFALLLAALAVRADDAVRRDGTQVEGRLSLSTTGRFAFTTEPVANLEVVRFRIQPIDPPPAALRMRVRLAEGEVLLTEVVKLDATHLHARPPWGRALAIPRAAIDGVSMSRPGAPRAWADLTADGVRSPAGDETFGAMTAIDPTGATLGIKGRSVVFGWPDVAELAFRRGPVPERPTTGEQVRLRVRTDNHRDILAGAVKAFDDKAVVLNHPVLGDLTIPRDRVEEIRFAFHGRRVPVESGPHHLGTRPAFGFAVPKPTGLKLAKRVPVEAVPSTGFVVVSAAHVGRTGTPVEVWLNGDRLGTLNALADRADAVVRSYRVPAPAAAWRAGANDVELRLKADPDAKATGVDVRGVWLELHDGR
jgi:hypothetical protein